jgi:hypothetical protein
MYNRHLFAYHLLFHMWSDCWVECMGKDHWFQMNCNLNWGALWTRYKVVVDRAQGWNQQTKNKTQPFKNIT